MTDEQVMYAVKEGDLDKAAILYERYKKSLLNFFLFRHPDLEVAQDLTQQVFLRVLRYRHTYREGAIFKTWIYEVARNIFYDFLKQKHSQINIEQIAEVPDNEIDTDTEMQYQYLHKALEKLPNQYREVLLMSRFQHMNYEQIGTLLNLSVPNVKIRVFRAMQQLRELYFKISEE